MGLGTHKFDWLGPNKDWEHTSLIGLIAIPFSY